jgi:hypothetical protein
VQHDGGETVDEYVRELLGFAVVFNIGDLYYQQQLQEKALMRDSDHQSPTYISISLHLFLSISILFFAAGIKLVYDDGSDEHGGEGEENGHREEALLLCTSAAASILFIFLIRMQHKGAKFLGASHYRHFSYLYRGLVAGLCAIIPFFSYNPTWCISALFVLTSSLLIQVTYVYLYNYTLIIYTFFNLHVSIYKFKPGHGLCQSN